MSLLLLSYMEAIPLFDNFSYQILQGLIQNVHQIPNYSAEKMAELCNVSPSALRKFINMIGYDSYTEFRIAFRVHFDRNCDPEGFLDFGVEEIGLKTVLSSIRRTIDNVEEQIDESVIDAFVDAMHQANEIVICSPSSDSTQLLLSSQLMLDKKKILSVHRPKKISEYTKQLTPETLCIFLRVGRNSDCFTYSDLAALANQQVKLALISSYVNYSEQVFVNYPLCFRCEQGIQGEFGTNSILTCALLKYMQSRKQF